MDEKEIIKATEILAHKLKNPIHGALLNLDVLKLKLKKESVDKKALKHLEIAMDEVQRLHCIVKGFQDYLTSDRRSAIDLKKYLDQAGNK